jgi:hypothetical protein
MPFTLQSNAYLPLAAAAPESKHQEEKELIPQPLMTIRDNLIDWGREQLSADDFTKYNVTVALTRFFDNLQNRSIGSELKEKHYQEIHRWLERIGHLLRQPDVLLPQKKQIYKNLINQLSVCPNGIYTSIPFLCYQLTAGDDVQSWLARLRQDIVAQIADEILTQHYRDNPDAMIGMFPHFLEACYRFCDELKFPVLQRPSELSDFARDLVAKDKIDKKYFKNRIAELYQFDSVAQCLTTEISLQVYDLIEYFKKTPLTSAYLQESLLLILNKIAISPEDDIPYLAIKMLNEDEKSEPTAETLTTQDGAQLQLFSKTQFQQNLRPYVVRYVVAQGIAKPEPEALVNIPLYVTVEQTAEEKENCDERYVFETYDYSKMNSWLRSRSHQLFPYHAYQSCVPSQFVAQLQLRTEHAELQHALMDFMRDCEKAKPDQFMSGKYLAKWVARFLGMTLITPIEMLLNFLQLTRVLIQSVHRWVSRLDGGCVFGLPTPIRSLGWAGLIVLECAGVGLSVGLAAAMTAVISPFALIDGYYKLIQELLTRITNRGHAKQLEDQRLHPLADIFNDWKNLPIEKQMTVSQDLEALLASLRQVQVKLDQMKEQVDARHPALDQKLAKMCLQLAQFVQEIKSLFAPSVGVEAQVAIPLSVPDAPELVLPAPRSQVTTQHHGLFAAHALSSSRSVEAVVIDVDKVPEIVIDIAAEGSEERPLNLSFRSR